jgi:lysophospholipase L1-like esterase
VANLQLLGQRIAVLYKSLAILLLNAIVIFACLDLATRVTYKAHNALFPTPVRSDPRASSPFYRSEPWAAQYWREFPLARQMRYHAFLLYRRAPFKGETINIDQDGIRLTPGAECGPNAFKVFTFGPSTMWGTGSPDWGTIPSYLQTGMKKLKNGPVCVVNFGESGYVSTQSVIELMLQLQSGNIPDVTLFFDGVADIYTAYQSGRPGVHENFAQIAAKFEQQGDASRKRLPFELLKASSLHSLVGSLITKLRQEGPSTPAFLTYETMGIDADSLSDAIIQIYLSNYKIVDGLAQKYGFKAFFFWPPHITDGAKPLTPEEWELKRDQDPALTKLYLTVYRKIKPLIPQCQNLVYLGAIFDDYPSLLWLDDSHVTPVGHELIAQKILEVLKARSVFSSAKAGGDGRDASSGLRSDADRKP